MEILTQYGCFAHWWACLPAVPPSRQAVDWWAADGDGRCTRYERLKRVWFDTTRLLPPKSDPCRPHEFSKPQHGTHLTCKVWESFCIFDPMDWFPALLRTAGFSDDFRPIDVAWSYEFEAMVGNTRKFKLADIVLHARSGGGDESLVVVEVKRPGDELKESSELPDTEPASYLDREAFSGIRHRRLIYLVDASYAAVVRRKVNPQDLRWGVVTWAELAQLQQSLARALPRPLAEFVQRVNACQFSGVSFTGMNLLPVSAPTVDEIAGLQHLVVSAGEMPQYLAEFVAGATQFLHCLRGECPPRLAFPYLADEPSFQDIHHLPESQRQRTVNRRRNLWKLPATTTERPQNSCFKSEGEHPMLNWLLRKDVKPAPGANRAAELAEHVQDQSVPAVMTSFPNPLLLHDVLSPSDAAAVDAVLMELRSGTGSIGGITIGKKGGIRSLCYIGPLPTGADARIRKLLGGRFQVSAVRDPGKGLCRIERLTWEL